MILKTLFFFILLSISAFYTSIEMDSKVRTFNKGKDLLLVQFDCKTDADDLQTAAALATLLSDFNRYNAKEGRYLDEAIAAGGLDFSDLSEVCWI